MLWILLGLLAAGIAVLVVGIRRMAQRYRKLFSDAHFEEVYARIARAIATVEAARASPEPSDASDAFLTSAQVAFVVTGHRADGRHVLHVSLSQRDGPTTHAVADRFAFFLVAILDRNQLELTPFVTPSLVRHLVFRWGGSPLALADFGTAMEQLRTRYRPLPFRALPSEEFPSQA